MRDPEYDRFGPWIIEISDLDPPPPLFLTYLTRAERPLLRIKIPRKIDRRDAKPGMNLYDYMVTLFAEDLEILQRVDEEVLAWNFAYSDVQYIRQRESLLKGTLRLAMRGTTFELPFNTVSTDIISRLVGLIRARSDEAPPPTVSIKETRIDEEQLSFFFKGLLSKARTEDPAVRVLASQPETGIGTTESSPLRRLLFGLVSKTLLESLHLSNGRELKIISRGRAYKYSWQTIHGKDICYLPTSHLSGFTLQPDAQNTAVAHLTLQTPGGDISYTLLGANPSLDNYTQYLSAL